MLAKINKKLKEYIRVLKLARKPTMDEFSMIAKSTALGMFVIGLVGTILLYLGNLLGG